MVLVPRLGRGLKPRSGRATAPPRSATERQLSCGNPALERTAPGSVASASSTAPVSESGEWTSSDMTALQTPY